MFLPMPDTRASFSADDWGLSPAVNEAILELARAGVLRSVSLFANLPYLEHGLNELERAGVELAAHLNFTLGRPLSDQVPSLVNPEGRFRAFRPFLWRGLFGLVCKEEVRREAEAQLRLLGSRCAISSVNGHQHAHLLPWMAEPIALAAKAFGIQKVRMMEDPAHRPSLLATRWSRGRYRRAWPEAELEPAHYLWPTGAWSPDRLAAKIEKAEGRALLVHPATADDFYSVEFADSLRAERVREFRSLRERESR